MVSVISAGLLLLVYGETKFHLVRAWECAWECAWESAWECALECICLLLLLLSHRAAADTQGSSLLLFWAALLLTCRHWPFSACLPALGRTRLPCLRHAWQRQTPTQNSEVCKAVAQCASPATSHAAAGGLHPGHDSRHAGGAALDHHPSAASGLRRLPR